jgi:hypothetical protein
MTSSRDKSSTNIECDYCSSQESADDAADGVEITSYWITHDSGLIKIRSFCGWHMCDLGMSGESHMLGKGWKLGEEATPEEVCANIVVNSLMRFFHPTSPKYKKVLLDGDQIILMTREEYLGYQDSRHTVEDLGNPSDEEVQIHEIINE